MASKKYRRSTKSVQALIKQQGIKLSRYEKEILATYRRAKADQQKAALKQFRADVAALKRAGLLSEKVKPRSQKPTKYMKQRVASFGDVLSGKAVAMTIKDPKIRKAYKDNPTREVRYGSRNKVIVKNDPNTKAVVKNSIIRKIRRLGEGKYERILLPIKVKNMNEFLNETSEQRKILNSFKNEDEKFGFRFYGNTSNAQFYSLEELAEWLAAYNAFEGDKLFDEEVFSNVELFRVKGGVPRSTALRRQLHEQQRKRKSKPMNEETILKRRLYRSERYYRMKERDPEKYAEIAEQKRAASRARYNALTPEQRKELNETRKANRRLAKERREAGKMK